MISADGNATTSQHVNFRDSTFAIEICTKYAVILAMLADLDCIDSDEHASLSSLFIDYLKFGLIKKDCGQLFLASLNLLDPKKYHLGLDAVPHGVRFELQALLEQFHYDSSPINRVTHLLASKVPLLKNSLKISPNSCNALSSLRSTYMSSLGSYFSASRISCSIDLLHPFLLNFSSKQYVGLSHYAYGHQCHNFDLFTKACSRDIQDRYCLSVIPGYSANSFLELLNRAHASSLGIEVIESTDLSFYLGLILGGKFINDSHCFLNGHSQWYPVALSMINYEQFSDERYSVHINLRMNLLKGLDASSFVELYRAKHNLRNYVTIYYRSEGYKGEATSAYNMFRNSSPDLILEYIRKLNARGFCVVLLGDASQKIFDYESTLFFDYSHSSHKNDVNDIDLVANAMACISGFGGGFYMPYMFDKPTLLIDWPMTFKPIWAPLVRVAPRRMKLIAGGEIDMASFFTNPLNFLEDGQVLYEYGVHIDPNRYASDSTVGSNLDSFFSELSNPSLMASESLKWAFWSKPWGYNYPVGVPVTRES